MMLWALLFAVGCGGGSSTGSGAGATSASPAGGCSVGVSYCYDFVGASWDASLAEAQCDAISDDLVAGGAGPAVYEATGCPANATAECTGFDGMPGDPDSEIIIYYYEDPPLAQAEAACDTGGGTYTLY